MNKQTLTYLGIGLLVFLVGLIALGSYLGWFQKGKLKLVDGEGEVDRQANGAIEETRYYSIAQGVKNSLEGVNYQATYFINVADQILALNNNEIRVVSNIYARDFNSKDYPTLRAIITGEYVGSTGFGLVPTPCTQSEMADFNSACFKQKKVLERLNSINA